MELWTKKKKSTSFLQVVHFSLQTCMQFFRWSYFLLKYFAGGPLFNPNLHTILQVIFFSVQTFCRWSTFQSKLAHSFSGGLIFYPNSPNNIVTGLIFTSKLTYDLASRLKRQLHNALVMIRGSQMEDGENVLPPRLNAGCLWVHHLCHAPHHHITDCRRSGKKNGRFEIKEFTACATHIAPRYHRL